MDGIRKRINNTPVSRRDNHLFMTKHVAGFLTVTYTFSFLSFRLLPLATEPCKRDLPAATRAGCGYHEDDAPRDALFFVGAL